MTDLRSSGLLKSQRFRQAREDDWRRLERLMDKAEKGSASKLTDAEILAVPVLYRSTLSALSVARETSLDQGLIDYLETLSARAYFFVYGSRATIQDRMVAFFRTDWPAAVRGLWRETLISAALMLLGALVAGWLVMHEPEWFYAFVPADLSGGRDPAASTETLRATLDGADGAQGLSAFAAYLFTHNAQVALLAFALGFALCLPTGLLILYNGATLGAFFALFASRGLGFELGGWLLIHGVTELFAVILAGAAGLRIGWAVAFPGQKPRLDAAVEAGRTAGIAMGGVVVMLMFAGLLEGFGRQLIVDTGLRYAVAAATAVIWGLYFYAPRPAVAESIHVR
ncbi:putative membrane protein SpoIIM required for sporulation [Brevundimonas vesicularis]|uniref:stage II sporulation protein M n=1 Tax=Brevundimonas vesicularis TaxID=41276 RepID=UPI00278A2669|nr:stage II sporulation protein M [Brevundimonas vesicularis]MDQ1193756.1 putative membrane protein SpoIIM required for sporulation [Brevundimonas vesicularis]